MAAPRTLNVSVYGEYNGLIRLLTLNLAFLAVFSTHSRGFSKVSGKLNRAPPAVCLHLQMSIYSILKRAEELRGERRRRGKIDLFRQKLTKGTCGSPRLHPSAWILHSVVGERCERARRRVVRADAGRLNRRHVYV